MSKNIAYGGILLGINLILLLLVNIISINTLFLMGIASLLISIIIIEFGPKSGIAFYVGTLVLSFIIMNNKIQWITYSLTFGIYGLVKYYIEKDIPIYIEYILKLLFANILIFILYFLFRSFVYIKLNIVTLTTLNFIFLIYDRMYTSFIRYYNKKLRKLMKI